MGQLSAEDFSEIRHGVSFNAIDALFHGLCRHCSIESSVTKAKKEY